MQLANSTTRYGAVPQLIHWLTALFVIVGWLLGQFSDDLPKHMHPLGLFLHMTLGEGVIALLLIRLFWRVANPPPPAEPTPLGRLVTLAAKLSHFALYALLLLVPVLGIIVQLKRGHDLPILGLGTFASPWPADRTVARSVLFVHYWSANTLLILAGIHAIAAIVHHSLWKDRTMVRMLPGAA
jgi:cytochrome b561